MLGRLRLAAGVLPLVLVFGAGCTDVEHTGSTSLADTTPKESPDNLVSGDPCRDGSPAPCVPKSERSSWQQMVTDRVPYVGYTVNILTGNVDPNVCLAKTCAPKDNGGVVDPGAGPGSEDGLELEGLTPLADPVEADPCKDYSPCDRVATTVQAFLSSINTTESLVNSVGGSLNFSAGGGVPWLSGSVGASVASEYRTANNALTTRVNGGLIGFTGLLMPKKPVLADRAKNELRKAYGTDAGVLLKQKRALGFLKLCKMGYVYGTAPAAYVDIAGKKTMSEVSESGEFNASFEAEVKSVYASGSVKSALKTMKESKSGKSDFEATATLRGITIPEFAATVDLSTDPDKKIDDMIRGMLAQLNNPKAAKPDKPGPVMIANYKHTDHDADDDDVLDEVWKIGRFLQNRLRQFDRAIGVVEFEADIAQLIAGPAKWRFNYPSEPGNLSYAGVEAFLKAVDAARADRVAKGQPVTGPEWNTVVNQALADTWNAKKENQAVAYAIADIPDMPLYLKKFNDLKDALRKARSACNEDIDNGFKKCFEVDSINEALNWANIFYVHRPVMLNAIDVGYAHSRSDAMKMCADRSTDDRKLALIGATPDNKLFPAPDKGDKDEVNADRTWARAMFNFGARWARNEFGRIAQKSKSADKTGMFWVGTFIDAADIPKGQKFYGRVLASRQDSFVKPADVADADWHPENIGWQIQSVVGNTTNFGYKNTDGFKAICVTVNPTGSSKLSGAFSNPFSDRQLIDNVVKGK